MPDTTDLSQGFLPLAPLLHPDPTAIGVFDLVSTDQIWRPAGAGIPEARDQLVLARLHQEPLGIVHLPVPPAHESLEELVRSVWRQAGPQIVRHAERCGCMPIPADADALLNGAQVPEALCSCSVPVRPPGQAAVIVATVGRLDVLERCVEALCALRCDDFEVVVVDNRPWVGGTRELVERYSSRAPIRYVAESRPGLSAARNAGLVATAGATYVAFTDDDVVMDERWLSWLLAPFTEPAIQGVTGLVMPLALRSEVEKRFEQYAGFGKGVVPELYDLDENRSDDRLLYPYWGGMFGSGNSMAFRRDALIRIGMFDLALGAGTRTGGGEDIAAFTEILLAGGRLAYEPRSVCWHEHRGDEAALRAQVRNYGIGLTAVFWRFLWRDWGFLLAAVRSLPPMVRLMRSRRSGRQDGRLLTDLSQIEMRGRLLGPWAYFRSKRLAARD